MPTAKGRKTVAANFLGQPCIGCSRFMAAFPASLPSASVQDKISLQAGRSRFPCYNPMPLVSCHAGKANAEVICHSHFHAYIVALQHRKILIAVLSAVMKMTAKQKHLSSGSYGKPLRLKQTWNSWASADVCQSLCQLLHNLGLIPQPKALHKPSQGSHCAQQAFLLF